MNVRNRNLLKTGFLLIIMMLVLLGTLALLIGALAQALDPAGKGLTNESLAWAFGLGAGVLLGGLAAYLTLRGRRSDRVPTLRE